MLLSNKKHQTSLLLIMELYFYTFVCTCTKVEEFPKVPFGMLCPVVDNFPPKKKNHFCMSTGIVLFMAFFSNEIFPVC